MADNTQSAHRWYVITLASLTSAFAVALPMSCMPVLFNEISKNLGLSLVQIGTVWGMIPFGNMLVFPISGLLCDRFGVKRTLVFACLLGGLSGALRGFSNDFASLAATSFLWGILSSLILIAITLAASLAYPKQQQGLAQGFLLAAAGIGQILGAMISATTLSPLLSGWRNVLFLYGGISTIIGLLWLITVREPERTKAIDSEQPIPLRRALSQLLHIKAIWLLGLTMLAYLGCAQGMSGFLPLYLRGSGWTAATADGTLAAHYASGALGAIPLTLLSDKAGSRKIALFLAFLTAIVGVGLLSVVHNEIVWALVTTSGIFRGMTPALLVTMCIETNEVRSGYTGTAVGLLFAISNVGSILSPPIGNSLADINFGLPFISWAALAAVGIVTLTFVKETGWRVGKV